MTLVVTGRLEVPGVAGKQPLRAPAPQSAPIIAKRSEQLRTQHDVAVAIALATMNLDRHPLAVDVADFQMRRLRAARTGGIKSHQHGAMKRAVGRVDDSSHFLRTENLRQLDHLPRIRRLGNAPAPLEDFNVEETQSGEPTNDRVGTVLQLAEQHRLVLATCSGPS